MSGLMLFIVRLLAGVGGVLLVFAAITSAIQTFVLPRNARNKLSLIVFRLMRLAFNLRTWPARDYNARDAILAFYAPVSLLVLVVVWLLCVGVGYWGIFWAVRAQDLAGAYEVSGSSLLTLGFASLQTPLEASLAFSEATIGLILIAILIAYLPTMYAAWSRRESAVTLLEVRAGSPPSAVELIVRYWRLERIDQMHQLWVEWEQWFAETGESHTSLAALPFFRSPQPDRCWVTAAGAVLDGAALYTAAVDLPADAQRSLCIRAGYVALREIANYFEISHDHDPKPHDPISIDQAEFAAALDLLAAEGVPLKADREQAWRDFAGWRVNYDHVLVELARLVQAPPAPWSSDRLLKDRMPLVITVKG